MRKDENSRFDLLDAGELMLSLMQLRDSIAARFPERGLSKVATRIIDVAREAEDVVERAIRPNWPLRIGLVLFMITTIAAPILAIIYSGLQVASLNGTTLSVVDLFEGLDGLFNIVVLGLAGIVFVTTLEDRIKRRKVLTQLHRIRSLVHVVDMHQMTKDPGEVDPADLRAYLGYCTDLLSLLGKIAALYAQGARDAVVIDTVNDIELLANNLSRKMWQKISLADKVPLANEGHPPHLSSFDDTDG